MGCGPAAAAPPSKGLAALRPAGVEVSTDNLEAGLQFRCECGMRVRVLGFGA